MKKPNANNPIKILLQIATPVIIILIFIADYYTAGMYAIAVLYVIPVLITLFQKGKKNTIFNSILVSAVSIFSYFYIEASNPSIINLIIVLTGIWIGFAFINGYKNHTSSEAKHKERLNAMFNYATEGILIANKKGEIILINPTAEKLFGYALGELENKQIEVLIPERMSERHVKHREKYSHNPYPRSMGRNMELFAKKKDGSEFPVEISLSNFETEDGTFVIAFIIDISERKKSESLLRHEKELAQMYLDIAPVIFIVTDANEKLILINQSGCRILGYQENEIIGKNQFELFSSKADLAASRLHFKNLLNGNSAASVAVINEIVTAKNEIKVISWKNTILRDEKGNALAVLSAGEDITEKQQQDKLIQKANIELKGYSDEILKLNADLELRVQARTEELASVITKLELTNSDLAVEIRERRQAEQLLEKKKEELRVALEKEKVLSELKSRFVTMASHEFRTPLSTILSSVSLIAKYNEPGQDEKRFKHINRIKSSVSNLVSILNDFLSLGKLEEGKVQCNPILFNIQLFSEEIVNEMREVSKPGQTIEYNHVGKKADVQLDKNLTRNIYINLISNAIKYSKEGEKIKITTTIDDHLVKIEISDRGIGIPESEQQHIFERFFRANNAANIQGTGLGLNIVKKYTDLMKGEISFASSNETGTTFTVKFPTV